jgi:hypothetical protein
MKYPALCLAAVGLLGLGGCSVDTVSTAWHWRDFAGAPDSAHFKALHDDLEGCRATGCSQGEWIADKEIEALADRVRTRNPLALRIAMAGYSLTRDHELATRHLDAAIGNMAQTDAHAFLSAALAEKIVRPEFVSQFGSQLADDYEGQFQALVARRAAIANIADPALQATRTAYLAILDKAVETADHNRYPMPRPVA